MTLVGRLRAYRYANEIERRSRDYAYMPTSSERHATQLDLLNETWERNLATVPYFRALHRSAALPTRFASLEEFAALVPATTRSVLQNHREELTSSERPPDAVAMTGGSTARPVRIPTWSSETRHRRPDAWVARGWYGIRPDSRLFHLWGHSHLLGTGLKGWLNARKRELFDRLLGYRRFSAYDLQAAAMARAVRELIAFRPDYVLGYSLALHLLGRAALERKPVTRSLGVRAVIGTAERFPSNESVRLLSDVFACPVAMEYGAMETGLVAHTYPEGGYRVFWRSVLLETDANPGGRGIIRVTSLYPRSLPLVRYEIGDEIELSSNARKEDCVSLGEFDSVVGRLNDYLELPDGTLVHSEALSHAVRPCETIRAFQVHQSGGEIELRYTADRELSSGEIAGIHDRLGKVDTQLTSAPLVRVDRLEQSVAGKTRMVVRES